MKDIGLTKPAGRNDANSPAKMPKAPGPKATNNGVSMTKGYEGVAEGGMGPHAVTPND